MPGYTGGAEKQVGYAIPSHSGPITKDDTITGLALDALQKLSNLEHEMTIVHGRVVPGSPGLPEEQAPPPPDHPVFALQGANTRIDACCRLFSDIRRIIG